MNIVNNADIALIKSFNGKFRAKCLNQNWFLLLADAGDRIESWRMDYNHYRPHSPDLPGCYMTTAAFMAVCCSGPGYAPPAPEQGERM